MAILSTVGIFFILAMLAGHLRVTGRHSEAELAAAAADAIDDGIQIAAGDGTVHYASRAFRDFLGTTAAGSTRTLEDAMSADPAAAQALFRRERPSAAAATARPFSDQRSAAAAPVRSRRRHRDGIGCPSVRGTACSARRCTARSRSGT